ncbi:MAG TPA: MlaD family protein [Solirubrobacterales bacterium]
MIAPRLAKVVLALTVTLFAAAVAALVVTSKPSGGREVVVEFRDAFPLIEGMHVRVDGAIAGSVGSVEVSDEGLARVTLALHESIEAPRADAKAAIRQQDTTGDSYVDFDPGSAPEELPSEDGVPILRCAPERPGGPCAASLVAPRFEHLLDTFGPRERAGIRLILGELAAALERRGDDVNAAALELRPALEEANLALAEVSEQNAALRSFIEDAEAVTGQGAARRAHLGSLISGLERTLAATAAEAEPLDAALARLPATTARARDVFAALRRAADAGAPLARELASSAPDLATSLRALPAFTRDADAGLERLRPTLKATRRLVRAAAPTIAADPNRVLTGPFDLVPALSNLLTGVLGDENLIKALFGDDSGGVGEGTLDNWGFGAVTVEPANQLLYPGDHALRRMARLSVVLNCEVFSVEVKPGCLADVLDSFRGRTRARAGGEPSSAPAQARQRAATESPADGLVLPKPSAPAPAGDRGKRGSGRGEQAPEPQPPKPSGLGGAVKSLLDFLLGP